jgi:hypothetical protein
MISAPVARDQARPLYYALVAQQKPTQEDEPNYSQWCKEISKGGAENKGNGLLLNKQNKGRMCSKTATTAIVNSKLNFKANSSYQCF